ncbi:S41 family peptidase [Novacetimonas cocois]|uniref:S41 family peptidase n=1 Tax=Novacetimonas cocois TaxID=1747507 RepID=UPI001057B44E|nr:S41 family peptidase [Novacetimonas cocois]
MSFLFKKIYLSMLTIICFFPTYVYSSEKNWSEITTDDVKYFHDDIESNHPGTVNSLDPNFNSHNNTAYHLALERARTVNSYSGYYWTLYSYAASFNDGHVGIYPTQKAPNLSSRWPGFLTSFDNKGKQVVLTHLKNVPIKSGSVLISCDGITAETLADRNVGAFTSAWQLVSKRQTQGWRLFIDQGNPFIKLPRRCLFAIGNHHQTLQLNWRNISAQELEKLSNIATQHSVPPIELRVLSNGTYWMSMSGFDGTPGSSEAQALTSAVDALKSDRNSLLASPRLVLDLRGNTGGSSDWPRQIANIIWGHDAVEAVPSADGVDWRASAGNLETLSRNWERANADPNTSPEVKTWFTRTIAGITEAHQQGRPYWTDRDTVDVKRSKSRPETHLHPTVFLLTDERCFSACLDAVDLWRALGGIQVGYETSADTLYMDTRSDRLPSGLVFLSLPMKVYRGRQRGSNIPWKPVYYYDGDIRDTNAVASWIARLPLNKTNE